MAHRRHVVAEAREARTFAARDALRSRGAVLGEARIEEANDRDIEAVEPDDRHIRVVPVVVPGPARRDDEIAGTHARAFAIHGREGSGTLDDEAQRALGVAVAWRDFTGQDQL